MRQIVWLVKKRRLLLAVVTICVIFAVIQLGLSWRFSSIEQKADFVENDSSSSTFEVVEAFTDICHRHGFPVFVIDPPLLEALMSNRSTTVTPSCRHGSCRVDCNYFCTDRRVTTFGVIDQLFRIQEAYEEFNRKGFVVTSVSEEADQDFFSNQNKTEIPTHYIFQHENKLFIHLVIFYQIQKNFYWHGRQTWNKEDGAAPSHQLLQFGQDEGVYTSLDMVKVKIDGLKLRAPVYPLKFLRQVLESNFKKCNQSQADKFYKKYGQPEETAKAKHFHESAKELLSVAKNVLDDLGVRFWISSGTCLGWFRQCNLIPYSKDVDIGVWIRDYDQRMISFMQNAGLALIHKFGKVNDSYELSFSGGDIKLDVFFFYEEQEYMWNGGTQARTGKKFKYLFQKFQLCWTLFLQLKVRVPCDTKSYVEANYGKNWFEPVKTWDWKTSPTNVQENGEWPEDERADVIQIYS